MASISRDGTHAVSASDDGTARVWDLHGHRPPLVLAGHETIVRSARFHPDGTRVVTASHDGTVRIWRIDWAGLLQFTSASPGCLSADERVEYLGESRDDAAEASALCERTR
jgi:WD40 repeat protein